MRQPSRPYTCTLYHTFRTSFGRTAQFEIWLIGHRGVEAHSNPWHASVASVVPTNNVCEDQCTIFMAISVREHNNHDNYCGEREAILNSGVVRFTLFSGH